MSADKFDPYYKWLGIGPDERPITYYRLLGIRNFEEDEDVIDSSADRQMAHLQSFKIGKHADLSQRLLNELSAARVCLLNKEKKAAYDRKLKKQLEEDKPEAPPQIAVEPVSAAAPAREPGSVPLTWVVAGSAALIVCGALGLAMWGLSGGTEPPPTKVVRPSPPKTKTPTSPPTNQPGVLAFNWPLAERQRAALNIDGQQQAIPREEHFEINVPPGNHDVTLTRHAHQPLKFSLALKAGQTKAIPFDWKPAARLTFDWPADARAGATLTINGARQQLPDGDPIQLAVEPGEHTVLITKPGFQPFRRLLSIEPGASVTLEPQLAALGRIPGKLKPPFRKPLPVGSSLLPLIQIPEHVVHGKVERDSRQLQLAPKSAIELPRELPGEYALFLIVNRLEKPGGLVLSVPRGNQRFVIRLGVGPVPHSGLELADKPFEDNETTRRGEIFTDGPTRILCLVRDSGIGVAVHGTRVVDFQSSSLEPACPEQFQPRNPAYAEIFSTGSPLRLQYLGLIKLDSAATLFEALPPLAMRTETPTPTPVEPAPPEPPAQPKRLPVPTDAAKSAALAQIKEIFATEYRSREPAAQIALARRLMQEAIATTEDPASRYVLLEEARTFATRWGELDTAWESINAAARWYDVDALDLRVDVLKTASRRMRGPQLVKLAEHCLQSIHEAVRDDRYDVATTLVTLAVPAARGSQNTELNDLAQARAGQVRQLRDEYRRIERSLAALEEQPDDPEASLAVGRFYALYKGDWKGGLPLLAQGSEGPLKQLAILDLDDPEENEQQVALGDAWWDQGESARDLPQVYMQNRAAYWYRKAMTDASGIVKTRIERRIADVPKPPFGMEIPQATNGPALPELSPEEVAKQHRGLAERVIKLGGYITVRENNGSGTPINAVNRLPNRPFLLARVYLNTNGTPELNDQHLSIFEDVVACPELYLLSPRITDAGINWLSAHADLTGLVLNQSSITDVGLAPLAKCPHLHRLEVTSPQITGVGLAQLAGMESLQMVTMRGPAVSDRVFESAAKLPRIFNLEVQSDQLTGAGLAALKGNANLRTLSVMSPGLTDEAIDAIVTMPNLNSLTISGGRVTEAALANLLKLQRLNFLNLNGPQVTDALIPHLAKFPQLIGLGLTETNVRGSTIASLAALRTLTTLSIYRCDLGDAGLAEVAKISSLTQLRLSRLKVTDAGVSQLVKLKQLQYLGLNRTETSDASIPALQQLTNLQTLDLTRTNVTSAGANALRQALPNCRISN